jgi:hypothetical protein
MEHLDHMQKTIMGFYQKCYEFIFDNCKPTTQRRTFFNPEAILQPIELTNDEKLYIHEFTGCVKALYPKEMRNPEYKYGIHQYTSSTAQGYIFGNVNRCSNIPFYKVVLTNNMYGKQTRIIVPTDNAKNTRYANESRKGARILFILSGDDWNRGKCLFVKQGNDSFQDISKLTH